MTLVAGSKARIFQVHFVFIHKYQKHGKPLRDINKTQILSGLTKREEGRVRRKGRASLCQRQRCVACTPVQ